MIYRSNEIQYNALALKLFGGSQIVVPFLGAGASLKGDASPTAASTNPPAPKVKEACDALGLDSAEARRFLEAAIQIAWRMQHRAAAPPSPDPYQRQKSSTKAPSSRDLAEVFAFLSGYDCFERPARKLQQLMTEVQPAELKEVCRSAAAVTGVADTAPPLLSAASFYGYTQPGGVRSVLDELFANVSERTQTHRLAARMAQHFIENKSRESLDDYLIITTNYDRLIEAALDDCGVAYLTLTVDKNDRMVYAIPSPGVKNYLQMDDREYSRRFLSRLQPKVAEQFFLPKVLPLVIVYKIHGALEPVAHDSIILSDEDYITFIQRNSEAEGMVPSPVVNLLDQKGLLMMGYSFSDWNIRALFKRFAAFSLKRKDSWAVIRHYERLEQGYFDHNEINVLEANLDEFADKCWQAARAAGLTQGDL